MNARTIMITAGALFVLAAPAAQANLDRVLPAKASITKHHTVVAKHSSTAGKAAKAKTARTTPLYIYYPAPLGAVMSTTSADDCVDYMVNCTDEQLCTLWGANCDAIVTSPATDATPVEPVQAASPQSEAPSNEAPPVDTSGSNNGSASNSNSLLCPQGGVWDEDYQTCV